MIEIRGNSSEQGQKETCGNLGEERRSRGIEMNERWIRAEIWNREPTAETVERLIKWFQMRANSERE